MKALISVALLVFVCFFQKGDTTITWTGDLSGGSGTVTVNEDLSVSSQVALAAATTDGTTVTFTLDSPVTPFDLTGGSVTITGQLDYETAASHTLLIVGVDDATTPDTQTATLTVSVTNVAPSFSNTPYTACVVDNSGPGTTVTTVTATDAGSGTTVTYSGVDTTTFLISSGGVITVATGATLTLAGTPYEFKPIATDASSLATTSTVTVTVSSTCSSAMTVAISMMTLLAALFAYMF